MADLRRFMDGRTKTYDANLVLGAAGYNYATSLPGKDAHNASAAAATARLTSASLPSATVAMLEANSRNSRW